MQTLFNRQLSFQQGALNLHARRQELLAANIANADTPHYKARDVDFRALLQEQLERKRGLGTLAATDAQHFGSGALRVPTVQYRGEHQSAVDGNTVDMDVERSAFAENSLRYEATLTFINGMLRSMNTAITGQ